ncbi:MAG: hypothetical protein ACR2NU_13710, partial [Aeoliella sp.]
LEAMNAFPLAQFYLLEPVFTLEPYLGLYTAADLREEAQGDRRVAEQIARQFGWAHRLADWSQARAQELYGVAIRAAAWTIELLATEIVPSRHVHPRPHVRGDLAGLLANDTLVELTRRAESGGSIKDMRRLRRAIEELQWRTTIDPVLCFELPDQPGALWFESHWFVGADGRRYVHY